MKSDFVHLGVEVAHNESMVVERVEHGAILRSLCKQTEVYRGIVRTLARVVESVPVVYLENRPEQEAVQLVWEKYDTGHLPC